LILIQSNILYKFNFSAYLHAIVQKQFMNKIKEVLQEKGIKQTWLAEKLGKSYNMLNSYEQNRQQPRLEVLNDIAKILDLDVVELIISSKKK